MDIHPEIQMGCGWLIVTYDPRKEPEKALYFRTEDDGSSARETFFDFLKKELAAAREYNNIPDNILCLYRCGDVIFSTDTLARIYSDPEKLKSELRAHIMPLLYGFPLQEVAVIDSHFKNHNYTLNDLNNELSTRFSPSHVMPFRIVSERFVKNYRQSAAYKGTHVNVVDTKEGLLYFDSTNRGQRCQSNYLQHLADHYFDTKSDAEQGIWFYTAVCFPSDAREKAYETFHAFSLLDESFIAEKANYYPCESLRLDGGGSWHFHYKNSTGAFMYFIENFQLKVSSHNAEIAKLLMIFETGGLPDSRKIDLFLRDDHAVQFRPLFKELEVADSEWDKIRGHTVVDGISRGRLSSECKNNRIAALLKIDAVRLTIVMQAHDILSNEYKIKIPDVKRNALRNAGLFATERQRK